MMINSFVIANSNAIHHLQMLSKIVAGLPYLAACVLRNRILIAILYLLLMVIVIPLRRLSYTVLPLLSRLSRTISLLLVIYWISSTLIALVLVRLCCCIALYL